MFFDMLEGAGCVPIVSSAGRALAEELACRRAGPERCLAGSSLEEPVRPDRCQGSACVQSPCEQPQWPQCLAAPIPDAVPEVPRAAKWSGRVELRQANDCRRAAGNPHARGWRATEKVSVCARQMRLPGGPHAGRVCDRQTAAGSVER
jgi:hypothetical protein